MWVTAKFDTCTVVNVIRTLVKAKMCTFILESTHFIFNKCPIYTHDGASAKFSTASYDTYYSVVDSGIVLSYQTGKQHRLADQYNQPMPESTTSPQSGTKNLATYPNLLKRQPQESKDGRGNLS